MEEKGDWQINFSTELFFLYTVIFSIPSIFFIFAVFTNLASGDKFDTSLRGLLIIALALICFIIRRNLSLRKPWARKAAVIISIPMFLGSITRGYLLIKRAPEFGSMLFGILIFAFSTQFLTVI